MNFENDGAWHREFLALVARRMKPSTYLELGLSDEPAMISLFQDCGHCVGVDVNTYEGLRPRNSTILKMTTDDFFKNMAPGPFDLVFIDADHRYEQVCNDLSNVWNLVTENGLIVLHDTFPRDKEETSNGYCSNSYKVPATIARECVTLPFPPGVTIIRPFPALRFTP